MNEPLTQELNRLAKQLRLEVLRRDLKKSIDSLDRGEGSPLDMKAIKAKARAIKERQA